jgi:hypothetical protein
MSGKPSVPLLLPPLSREALSQIHEVEAEVREALEDCTDPILGFTNPEKKRQIVRTYLVAAIDVKMDYYSSLPIYQVRWIPEIIISIVNFFLGMLHPFATNEQLRNDLLRTAAEHLAQKRIEADAIKNVSATSAPPKPASSERTALRDPYLANFPNERIKIIDPTRSSFNALLRHYPSVGGHVTIGWQVHAFNSPSTLPSHDRAIWRILRFWWPGAIGIWIAILTARRIPT